MRSSPCAKGPGDYYLDQEAADEEREEWLERREANDRGIEDDVADGLYDE